MWELLSQLETRGGHGHSVGKAGTVTLGSLIAASRTSPGSSGVAAGQNSPPCSPGKTSAGSRSRDLTTRVRGSIKIKLEDLTEKQVYGLLQVVLESVQRQEALEDK